jgi:hypothetical protein
MAPKTSQATPITFRLENAVLDELDALALKLGVDRTTVIQRFLVAGLRVNPLSDADRQRFRVHRAALARNEVPGLLPLESVTPGGPDTAGLSSDRAEAVAPYAASAREHRKERG